MTGLFSLNNIRRGVRNPRLAIGAVRQLGLIANQWYYENTSRKNGTTIVEEDWDTLFILDGCRYDTFARLCSFTGELSTRRSWGSDSSEFIERNFTDRNLHDTIYVTANPFTPDIPDKTFFKVRNLLTEAWDDDLGTVRPEDGVRIAIDERDSHPDKRIIIHLMQPHFPFIGETGQKLEQGTITRKQDSGSDNPLWADLTFGHQQLPLELVKQAYRENLDLAFDAISEFLEEYDERIVLTADHGNLIGERLRPIPVRWYGHPPGIYVDESVRVPWFVIESENRREITSDEPITIDEMEDDTVNNRLKALGYR